MAELTAQLDSVTYEKTSITERVDALTEENQKLSSQIRELKTKVTHSEQLRMDNNQMTEEVETLKEQV